MRLVALLAMSSACSFHVGASGGGGGGGDAGDAGNAGDAADAPTDMLIDVPDGTSAFGDIDLIPALEEYAAIGDWTSGNLTIDTTLLTTSSTRPSNVTLTAGVQDNGASVAFLRVHDFHLTSGTTLRVVGMRPLVIIGDNDMTIDGTIDVGARAETAVAGGFAPAAGTAVGGNGMHIDPNDDGGGGGGGFGGSGGTGGTGGAAPGGAGGGTYAATVLLGGSGGGGPPQGISCSNLGGGGGGAILIFAKHQLTVTGAITAGGGGGSAGILCPSPSMYASGGGGGAGGLVYVQTPNLKGAGVLAANGGGGGGGACATGVPGPGQDGRPSTTTVASGGVGSTCGAAGGDGAIQGTAPSAILSAQYNGGGGGGGLGRIIVHAPSIGSVTTSPTAVVL